MLALGKKRAYWLDQNARRPFLYQVVLDQTGTLQQGGLVYDNADLAVATNAPYEFRCDDTVVIEGANYLITNVTKLRRRFTLNETYTQLTLVK